MIKKIWRDNILLLSLGVLILSSINVSAEILTDDADDVWRSDEYNSEKKEWVEWSRNVTDHPHIDIISVEYALNGSELTLTMTLKEEINESRLARYEIFYGTFYGAPFYFARYWADTGVGTYRSVGLENDIKGEFISPILEDGRTISVTFQIPETNTTYEIWGFACEQNSDDTKYWIDYVPAKYEPENVSEDVDGDDSNNDDNDTNETGDDGDENIGGNGDNGTPGFGIIILICAIAVIIFKKQKRNK